MARTLLGLLVCGWCGLLLFCGRAQADAATLLPPIAEPGVPDQDRLTSQQAVISYFAQLPEPIPLTSPEDGLPRAGMSFRTCGEVACAEEYAKALGVDFAVILRLFAPDRTGQSSSLSVALVTVEGIAYSGNVEIGDRGVHAATQQAVAIAFDRLNRGPGPWLKVDGPDGSRVRINAGAPQALPYMEKTEPGLQRIVVEDAQGRMLYEATINLPDDPAHYELVEISAEEAAQAIASAEKPRAPSSYWQRKRSSWNYIIGVPLAVAGLAYAIAGAVHHAKDGKCVNDREPCTEQYKANGMSTAELVLGIAGVAVGGGAFLGAGVLRERESTPSGAMLQLRSTF